MSARIKIMQTAKAKYNEFSSVQAQSALQSLTQSQQGVKKCGINNRKGALVTIESQPNVLTHEDLVLKIAQDRDKGAFKQLFAHFAPRVKSYLLKLGLDDHKAEDLAQDVLVTVWQKAIQFDPTKAKLSTWIFRISRNKFIDLTRKQKYPEVNADDHLPDMVAAEETDRPVEAMQTAAIVSSALTKLNPDQQKVIKLSFYEEMSHSEISTHLSLPLGTVKSRIRMAFQALRKELGEKE
jgi:RNA polymerase sigma-70 factor (ECF subfamily)